MKTNRRPNNKTRNTKMPDVPGGGIIRMFLCLALCMTFFVNDTTSVAAASTKSFKECENLYEYMCQASTSWKSYAKYSEDGESLVIHLCFHKVDVVKSTTWDNVQNDDSRLMKNSINLKKLLPEDLLEQFEDGEVYVYSTKDLTFPIAKGWGGYTYVSCGNTKGIKYAKKYLNKKYGKGNYKSLHYDMNTEERIAHSECIKYDMEYHYSFYQPYLISDKNGNGKISYKKFKNATGRELYLADKNGNKIIEFTFEFTEITGYHPE